MAPIAFSTRFTCIADYAPPMLQCVDTGLPWGRKIMGPPKKAISTILEHAPVKAAEHLPGVNLHVDDSAVRIESFNGTDGETDVFVFNAEDLVTNITHLRNFDAGEDFLRFDNMDGRDLIAGDLDGQGTHLVLLHSNGEGTSIWLFGVPHQQQDVLDEMILPFDGRLVDAVGVPF